MCASCEAHQPLFANRFFLMFDEDRGCDPLYRRVRLPLTADEPLADLKPRAAKAHS
jgi:hypothetical protein